MSDITERLRALYVEHGTNYVQEAADEIERLRAGIVSLIGLFDPYGRGRVNEPESQCAEVIARAEELLK